jgi:hypothetical protein
VVVVDGDPFELATLPERIAAVVKDGRLVAGQVGTGTAVSARAAWPAGGAAPGTATPG